MQRPFHPVSATGFFFALILLIYGQTLTGAADFFFYDDPEVLFRWGQGTSLDGWRFDVFLGQTFLVGDPGAMHPWGPLALLNEVLPAGKLAFHLSTLLLLTAACTAMYILLRRALPDSVWVPLLVAPLAVFNTYLSKCLLQRHWIAQAIAMPLCLLIIRAHLDRPRAVHVAQLALVSFAALFLGSAAAWSGAMVVAAVHVVIEAWCRRAQQRVLPVLLRGGLLIAAANVVMGLLGFWVFWAISVAGTAETLVRDVGLHALRGPVLATEAAHAWVPLLTYYEFLTYLLHVGWQPWAHDLIGGPFVQGRIVTLVSVVSPAALIFMLGSRRLSHWERVIVGLTVFLFAIRLLPLVPYYDVAMAVVRLRDLLHPVETPMAFAILQTATIALAVERVRAGVLPERFQAFRPPVAAVPMLFYGALLVAALLLMSDTVLLSAARTFAGIAAAIAGIDRALAEALLRYNFSQVAATMSPVMLTFYALSAGLAAGFVFPGLLRVFVGERHVVLAGGILAGGLLLALAIHPPNREASVWDDPMRDGRPLRALFQPWDRFYRVEVPPEAQTRDLGYFERFWFNGEFGAFHHRSGYELVPGGNLSMTKPFTPIASAAFMDAAFQDAGQPLQQLRHLIKGPLATSRLLDVAAVSYIYSERPLPENTGLELVHKSRQIYVYRRPDAFPFVYLAENILPLRDLSDMRGARPGDAFVGPADVAAVPAASADGSVEIIQFGHGRIEIRTRTVTPRLLVVADAWHPYWHAATDGVGQTILRVNGPFKGIVVPSGEHRVTFHFDAAPAAGGGWVSAVTWLLVLIGLWTGWRAPASTATR